MGISHYLRWLPAFHSHQTHGCGSGGTLWHWTLILLISPLSNPLQFLPTFSFSFPRSCVSYFQAVINSQTSGFSAQAFPGSRLSLVSIFWPLPFFLLLSACLLPSSLLKFFFVFYTIWSEFLSPYCIPGGKWTVDGARWWWLKLRGKRNVRKNQSLSSGNQCLGLHSHIPPS